MNAKENISKIKTLDRHIQCQQDELKELLSRLDGLSATDYGGISVVTGNTPKGAKFTRILEQIETLELKICQETTELLECRDQIRQVIEEIQDPDQKAVLHYHYILGHPIERTAMKMNISRSQAYSLFQRAKKTLKR